MAPRFGTDGIRGVANTELTAALALDLGRAAVSVLGTDTLVIGRDTRRSGPMLEAAMAAGAASAGARVELLGVLPTPAIAAVAAARGVAGAMISASHNPFADNGIKVFAPGGRKLTDDQQAAIEAMLVAESSGVPPSGADLGEIIVASDPGAWLEVLRSAAEPDALRGLSVVLDAAHGAGSGLSGEVLRGYGAEVHVIGAAPDGVNINDGYGSTHPERLQATVVERGADLGIALDGDADRLIAVDAEGNLVDGDRVIALLALDRRARGRLAHDTVVVTVMTNLGFHRAMAVAGVDVVTTAVGDRAVLEAMERGGYELGGEQSGHVISGDLAPTGDGLLTAIQLMDVVNRSGEPLGSLAGAVMTRVPQILKNVRISPDAVDPVARLGPDIAAAEAELGDDGRVLVRPSGTEPLLRIMVEAVGDGIAESICDRLVQRAVELFT